MISRTSLKQATYIEELKNWTAAPKGAGVFFVLEGVIF